MDKIHNIILFLEGGKWALYIQINLDNVRDLALHLADTCRHILKDLNRCTNERTYEYLW